MTFYNDLFWIHIFYMVYGTLDSMHIEFCDLPGIPGKIKSTID